MRIVVWQIILLYPSRFDNSPFNPSMIHSILWRVTKFSPLEMVSELSREKEYPNQRDAEKNVLVKQIGPMKKVDECEKNEKKHVSVCLWIQKEERYRHLDPDDMLTFRLFLSLIFTFLPFRVPLSDIVRYIEIRTLLIFGFWKKLEKVKKKVDFLWILDEMSPNLMCVKKSIWKF